MTVHNSTQVLIDSDQYELDLGMRMPGTVLPERVHRHEHMAFWQSRGNSRMDCAEQSFELSQGAVLWVPAGTPHVLTVRPDSILVPLVFPIRDFSTPLNQLAVIEIGGDAETLLLAMFATQNSVIQVDTEIERKVLAMLEGRFFYREDLPMPRSERATAVANALIANPADRRFVKEWAQELCVSSRSLERAFAQETGLTIGQWRTRCRMLAARRMLADGTGATSVSVRVGYESVSSFSRAFREFFGERPSTVMRSQLGG